MKIAIPVALIALGLIGLITMGVVYGGVPELQVRELLEQQISGRPIKVHGIIAEIQSAERPLRFTIHDRDRSDLIVQVHCDATRPDTFQETYDVAVVGQYDPDQKIIRADQIFTKCPSKYEAADKMREPPSRSEETSPPEEPSPSEESSTLPTPEANSATAESTGR